MKIVISESQLNRIIENEIVEGKHGDKDMKKLVSWAMKKLGCTSHSIKNGIKLCPPDEVEGFRCRTVHLTPKGFKPLQADIADWFGVSRRDVDTAFRLNQSLELDKEKRITEQQIFTQRIPGYNETTRDLYLDLREKEVKQYVVSKGGINAFFNELPKEVNSIVIRGPYDEVLEIDTTIYRYRDLVAMALVDMMVIFDDPMVLCNLPKFFYLDLSGSEHTFIPMCGKKMGHELYNLKL
jgi:hypothetical protein